MYSSSPNSSSYSSPCSSPTRSDKNGSPCSTPFQSDISSSAHVSVNTSTCTGETSPDTSGNKYPPCRLEKSKTEGPPKIFSDTPTQVHRIPCRKLKSSIKKDKGVRKKICFKLEDLTIQNIYSKPIECINPEDVKVLVEQENNDIETFSSIGKAYVPYNPSNFSPKKKLQQIDMNNQAIALLYQSMILPSTSADAAQVEATPEMMASIMHLIEKQIDPTVNPTKHFNALFKSEKYVSGDEALHMSPVADGHYQDVIVPLQEPNSIRGEMQTRELRLLMANMKKKVGEQGDGPQDNLFHKLEWEDLNIDKLNTEFAESLNKDDCGLCKMAQHIGAEPLDTLDITDTKQSEDVKKDMQSGIQYFIETNTPQYSSRIQLRGSEHPHWFPGYVYALPNCPEVVEIAKSPSEVFMKAWNAVHPKYFEEGSLKLR